MEFYKNEEYRRSGKNFSVIITHSTSKNYSGDGERNCWCIYAVITENHPLYDEIDGTSIDQEVFETMPLHGGCTYCAKFKMRCYGRDNVPYQQYYKIGCDYSHYMDDPYAEADSLEEGCGADVKRDAALLFEFLENFEGNV